jgi:hypothetical protein
MRGFSPTKSKTVNPLAARRLALGQRGTVKTGTQETIRARQMGIEHGPPRAPRLVDSCCKPLLAPLRFWDSVTILPRAPEFISLRYFAQASPPSLMASLNRALCRTSSAAMNFWCAAYKSASITRVTKRAHVSSAAFFSVAYCAR